jgi:transposase-like protein
MPKRYAPEFKRDVVAVARTSGLTHAQIAEDLGSSPSTRSNVGCYADVGITTSSPAWER